MSESSEVTDGIVDQVIGVQMSEKPGYIKRSSMGGVLIHKQQQDMDGQSGMWMFWVTTACLTPA